MWITDYLYIVSIRKVRLRLWHSFVRIFGCVLMIQRCHVTLPVNTTSVRFIDLVEGSLLLQLCKSVDIGQASEFLPRFEPFLSHTFFDLRMKI